MKNIVLILFSLLNVSILFSQIQHGGKPLSLSLSKDYTNNIPVINTSKTDVSKLRQEDLVNDKIKEVPWRYGYIHYVDINFEDGVYTYLENGDRIWRIKVKSANAQTLNLTFKNYKLSNGAKLFIYNEHNILGAFTAANNKKQGYLTTSLLRGDELTIELYEPKETFGKNTLQLERIVHGYRSLDFEKQLKGIGQSGGCNNNVICAIGDNWRKQIKSVGILLTQNDYNAGFCSGALINNSCNDETPYFLTANHCTPGPTSVVGFNFESLDCNTNNWSGNDNTISGLEVRAVNAGSDFCLTELSSLPPSIYNVYYSGWDHSDSISTMQVGIHHPSGDLKKISIDNQSPTQEMYSGAQCWKIGSWDNGTTEGGSSGSPLFNQNGHIIGQLYGGSASCTSLTEDYYGRFDISWDNGSDETDQLAPWLDKCNLGEDTLSGLDPNFIAFNKDVLLRNYTIINQEFCGEKSPQILVVKNKGFQTINTLTIQHGIVPNLSTYNWTGNLASNEKDTIYLDSLSLVDGNYNYLAYISEVNGTLDENQENDTISYNFDLEIGVAIEILLTTNFNGSENYFTITDFNGNIIEEEGPFSQTETYKFNYCLPIGNYCVNMYDDGGDGVEPVFFDIDQGNYTLIVNEEIIYSGDDFDSLQSDCIEIETAINEVNSFNDFEIYPNPNKGIFSINSEEKITKIEIVNTLGKRIFEKEIETQNTTINVSDFAKGVYFVKVYTTQQSGIKKMLIK